MYVCDKYSEVILRTITILKKLNRGKNINNIRSANDTLLIAISEETFKIIIITDGDSGSDAMRLHLDQPRKPNGSSV